MLSDEIGNFKNEFLIVPKPEITHPLPWMWIDDPWRLPMVWDGGNKGPLDILKFICVWDGNEIVHIVDEGLLPRNAQQSAQAVRNVQRALDTLVLIHEVKDDEISTSFGSVTKRCKRSEVVDVE